MPRFGGRRRTTISGPAVDAALVDGRRDDGPPVFELSPPECRALLRVIEHARACLVLRSGADAETIRNASGAELAILLRRRAAAGAGEDGAVIMRADEIRHLEAAVVNLESYGGHETALCEGYALLERCAALQRGARTGHETEGILSIGRLAPPAPGP
ncbi:hypothetical protein ACIRU2_11025 [Streptomyces sp. NPDC101169]|uniref:hypothetical protein n=1 Tax=Streptomyces sp. NPDC101169 TaxID=3366121 RepID=UPI00380238B2